MVALRQQRDLAEALARLAATLESLEFGPAAATLSSDRDRLAGLIGSYLIPKIVDPLTPLTVVLAGPTGCGKSTLINSLSGLDVSSTGAVRPTTRAPVVLTTPSLVDRYEVIGGVECQVVTGEAPILESMVLIDAPDLDSTSTGHRAMAEILIDNADIVVFVTSALRYADEVPWQVLRRAVSRGTPVIQVLNRVGSSSAGAMVDFRSRLSAAGLDDEVITVPEHHLSSGTQRVPSLAIRSLRNRLGRVVANKHEFAGRVFGSVLRSTMGQTIDIARAMTEIDEEIDEMATAMEVYLTDRVAELDLAGVDDGISPTLADQPSGRDIRRWLKTMRRVGADARRAAEDRFVSQMVSTIRSDIRHWIVEERSLLQEWHVDPRDFLAGVEAGARSSVVGWVRFVARIAADHDGTRVWPGEAALIHAVIAGLEAPAHLHFGEKGPELVERARRELVGRLGGIYRHAVDLVAEAIRSRYGELDDEELRGSLGAVTTTLAPVDA